MDTVIKLRSGFREWESLWEFSDDDDGPAFIRRGFSYPNTYAGDEDGSREVKTPEGVYALVFHSSAGHSAKFYNENESATPEQRAFIRGLLYGVLSTT